MSVGRSAGQILKAKKIIFFHSLFAQYYSSYKPVGAVPWPRNESCPTASGAVCVLFFCVKSMYFSAIKIILIVVDVVVVLPRLNQLSGTFNCQNFRLIGVLNRWPLPPPLASNDTPDKEIGGLSC